MLKKTIGFAVWILLAGIALVFPTWAQTTQASPAATVTSEAQASPTATPALEPPLKFSMNALVDTYYSLNFTNAAHGLDGAGNTGYFPNNQGDYNYNLHMAELAFTLRQGEGSVHLSVLGGNVAKYFNSLAGSPPVGDNIFLYEAYATYHPEDWTFSFGRMASFMGFEVLESNQDWNYSRSLLYTLTLPYLQEGFSINYTAPNNKVAITGYALDGWNDGGTGLSSNAGKTFGLKFEGDPSPDFKIVLNGITGPTGLAPFNDDLFARSVIEGTMICKASDDISIALDGEFISQNPNGLQTFEGWGGALYCRYQFKPDWAAVLRLEGIKIEAPSPNYIYLGSSSLPVVTNDEGREVTLTLEHHFTKHFLARIEGRYDYALSDGQVFTVGNGPFAGGDPNQITITASVIFSL